MTKLITKDTTLEELTDLRLNAESAMLADDVTVEMNELLTASRLKTEKAATITLETTLAELQNLTKFTKLALSTTSDVDREFIECYFADMGIECEIKEVKK